MHTYKSTEIAEYLLAKAHTLHLSLNVTKVQKLMYILYGYFLSKHEHKLIYDNPRAWPYGPVFPTATKKVDYTSIKALEDSSFQQLLKDEPLNKAIEGVLEKYAGLSASQLTEWSHIKDGPWDITTKQEGFEWNTSIEDELIKAHFDKFTVL